MTWFKVDDQITFHPKTISVGNAALGAWLRLGAYCSSQLTDGFVPGQVVAMVATESEVDALLSAKMIYAESDGYRLHDYLEYQPSKADVKADRNAAKERMSNYRRAKRSREQTQNFEKSSPFVPVGTGEVSGSDSESESDRAPGWFRESWCKRAGLAMIGSGVLDPVWSCVVRYAAAKKTEAPKVTDSLFNGYAVVTKDWKLRFPWDPALFVKHFDKIQAAAHYSPASSVSGDRVSIAELIKRKAQEKAAKRNG